MWILVLYITSLVGAAGWACFPAMATIASRQWFRGLLKQVVMVSEAALLAVFVNEPTQIIESWI